jgi:hypothetical protein
LNIAGFWVVMVCIAFKVDTDVSDQYSDTCCSVNVCRARNRLVYMGRMEGHRDSQEWGEWGGDGVQSGPIGMLNRETAIVRPGAEWPFSGETKINIIIHIKFAIFRVTETDEIWRRPAVSVVTRMSVFRRPSLSPSTENNRITCNEYQLGGVEEYQQ